MSPPTDAGRVHRSAPGRARRSQPGHGRICLAPADGSGLRQLTGGPNDDAGPRWSPDGSTLTFLSDRAAAGTVPALRAGDRRARRGAPAHRRGRRGRAPRVVARRFDDPGGGGRARAPSRPTRWARAPWRSRPRTAPAPPWLPEVESSDGRDERRALWLVDAGTGERRGRSAGRTLNIWEAAWCGNDLIVAIAPHGPGESAWYDAPARRIDPTTGARPGPDIERRPAGVGPGFARRPRGRRDRGGLQRPPSRRGPAPARRSGLRRATADRHRRRRRQLERMARRPAGCSRSDCADSTPWRWRWTPHPATFVRPGWAPKACGDFSPFASPIGTGDAFAAVVGGATRPTTLTRVEAGADHTLVDDRPRRERAHVVGDRPRGSGCPGRRPTAWRSRGLLTLPAAGTALTPRSPRPRRPDLGATTTIRPGLLGRAPRSRVRDLPAEPSRLVGPRPRVRGARDRRHGRRRRPGHARGLDHLCRAWPRRPRAHRRHGRQLRGVHGGVAAHCSTALPSGRRALAGHRLVLGAIRQQRWDRGPPISSAANRSTRRGLRTGGARCSRRTSPTPTLLTAGLHDRATPVGQATEFYRALRGHGVPADVVRVSAGGPRGQELPGADRLRGPDRRLVRTVHAAGPTARCWP